MSRFFDPKPADTSRSDPSRADQRLYAPATERNRDALLEVFRTHLPKSGTLVEVASGTGQHAAHMASHLQPLYWQPSDIEPDKLDSINAWAAESGAENILPAAHINVFEHEFSALKVPAPISAVAAINLIHIAPWPVAEALVRCAAAVLASGGASNGVLFLYGPYRRGGAHTSPSNESFDASLRSRDNSWGVRDLEDVSELAAGHGFGDPTIIEMPANNLSLIFKRQ